ncbi:hypothetical protein JAO76_05935 [Pontibacter sp. BT310]|uniref:STAS/SEC14 domain-containing protein n=1 Tax=Pontibacter populi TaxID=890055 RepID=A0ABS6X986_9BACT|nr:MULTISPECIES: hypothetical protein [Pontibacter]MBJ6117720.1 hypothetical protein [Pontibacter sp. BT310]MBR0570146.1 hypothetical protein [Microvirga sp. STS03]MBW3364572.1 hypothetical protein [Pontibacter populi]
MPTLQLTTVYSSDNFKIEADDGLAYVRTEWLRPLNDDQFVAETMRAYDVITEKQAERVLVNAQQVSVLGPETKDWLSNTYYSLFSRTSLKKMARVMPDNLFKKLALASVVARADAAGEISYQIQDFASENEAVHWLLEE